MLDLWFAIVALAGLLLFVELCVFQKIVHLEAQLDLHDKLLRHARLETQVAHSLAQTTHRLVTSAMNGEEARRSIQGAAVDPTEPGPGAVEFDLLTQRMRYRQAVEAVKLNSGAEKELFSP